jgi:hypothetical protein
MNESELLDLVIELLGDMAVALRREYTLTI